MVDGVVGSEREGVSLVNYVPGNQVERRVEEVIELLNAFEDWLSVYSYLIDSTFYLESFDEGERSRAREIEDCQSRTWVLLEEHHGVLKMKVDSEALIVKGLMGLLVRVVDGSKPDEVAAAHLDFLSRTMLGNELDDARKSGFAGALRYVSSEACRLADSKFD